MIHRARELRRAVPRPEQIVWSVLRGHRLGGLKFRRQEPIGPYVVDFCCRDQKLVVELDGMSHEDKVEYDRQRQQWLQQQGYRVIRVTNTDVNDLDAVARLIAREAGLDWNAEEKNDAPLPRAGEGQGGGPWQRSGNA
jgi:very-short-patch-repair endonuclease